MFNIKKILVPVDGSEYMEREIELSCALAKLFGAEITILHVVAIPQPSGIEALPEASKRLEEVGKKILEEAKAIAEKFGMQPKLEMDFSVSNPGAKIVKRAEESKADLIVIGARGRSRLREILTGSVANTVVNSAPCPVLVVRPP
ncbi:MAG: universal stress protein [Candidatus Methanomethylicaceae archaeon]